MFTAQATCARSSSTMAFDVVPLGVLIVVVRSQSGAPWGTRFWKNDFAPTPSGKRWSSVGRPPTARRKGSSTAR